MYVKTKVELLCNQVCILLFYIYSPHLSSKYVPVAHPMHLVTMKVHLVICFHFTIFVFLIIHSKSF